MKIFLLAQLFLVYLIAVNAATCPQSLINSYPCHCYDNLNETVSLKCNGISHSTDSKAAEMLRYFLSSSNVMSPLSGILLMGGELTKVPEEIRLFDKLEYVHLENNRIRSVQSGSFKFSKYFKGLWLDNNQIQRVDPGAFEGEYVNGSQISLVNNKLTRFESGAFKTVLEQMIPYFPHSFVSIDKNPIDCQSDPCHLSWLVKDNRHLLKAIHNGGQCSNGTWFSQLSPNSYDQCMSLTDNDSTPRIFNSQPVSSGCATNRITHYSLVQCIGHYFTVLIVKTLFSN